MKYHTAEERREAIREYQPAEILEMREIIGDISGELKALKNQFKWGTKK